MAVAARLDVLFVRATTGTTPIAALVFLLHGAAAVCVLVLLACFTDEAAGQGEGTPGGGAS